MPVLVVISLALPHQAPPPPPVPLLPHRLATWPLPMIANQEKHSSELNMHAFMYSV